MHVASQGAKRRGRQDIQHLAFVHAVLLPTQELRQREVDGVRLARVPVIMEAPDHELVLRDEIQLGAKDRVGGQILGLIQVAIEGRFVADDEVLPGRGGALQNVQSCHERSRNARYGRVRVAGLEGIYRLRLPGDANVFLDTLDDLTSRQSAWPGRQ